MRTKLILPAITLLTMVGSNAAFADAKSDYMAKCNANNSSVVAPYCECYYKNINDTYGIDNYNKMLAGQMTDKTKDPAVTKAYSAGMSSCAANAGKK